MLITLYERYNQLDVATHIGCTGKENSQRSYIHQGSNVRQDKMKELLIIIMLMTIVLIQNKLMFQES